MTISEKTAYLKGLTDGLGLDPASKEGKLWNALNDLLGDIAHELEDLRETDRGQAQAIDGVTVGAGESFSFNETVGPREKRRPSRRVPRRAPRSGRARPRRTATGRREGR